MPAIKKIICPVDFMLQSDAVADYTATLAKAFNAEVEVVHISFVLSEENRILAARVTQFEDLEAEVLKTARETMAEFLKKHFEGVAATGKILTGYPAEEILKRIKEYGADLVVMGTQGRKGLERFVFGSVAEKVVRMSPVPVLTIRV